MDTLYNMSSRPFKSDPTEISKPGNKVIFSQVSMRHVFTTSLDCGALVLRILPPSFPVPFSFKKRRDTKYLATHVNQIRGPIRHSDPFTQLKASSPLDGTHAIYR